MPFIVLALVYLLGRFVFGQWMNEQNAYGSYIFELLILAVYFFLLKKRVLGEFKFKKEYFLMALVAVGLGYGIYEYALSQSILIPFELGGVETLVFLLLVAPVLEELLFHGLLWKPFSRWPKFAFASTAILFSYAHYHSIWFYPEVVHPFIEYQTLYTLGLGLICGIPVYRTGSVAGAMLIHFGFNLGFYLGFAI